MLIVGVIRANWKKAIKANWKTTPMTVVTYWK